VRPVAGRQRSHHPAPWRWPRKATLATVLVASSGASAETPTPSPEDAVSLPTLLITAPVQNPGGLDDTGAGETVFDQTYVEQFGQADGTLDGVLKLVPGLQFGEDSESVEGLTELRPQSVSISGGRFYENQFVLDGLSNSNRLDPASDGDGSGIHGVAGHEQSLFLDAGVIDRLAVYDANVPAAYGGFTGGVVDATTRRAGDEPEGRVRVSGTHAGWTRFHVLTRDWDPDTQTEPPEPPDSPDFKRYRASATYATPLADGLGLLASLSESYASTPELTLDQTRNRIQRNRNLLFKLSSDVGGAGTLDLTATWAPYESEGFIENVRDSDYTLSGGGYGLKAGYEHLGAHLEQSLDLGWTRSDSSREAPNGYFPWENTRSRQWGLEADVGLSREGGYGDLDMVEDATSLGYSLRTLPVAWGDVDLHHEAGVDARHSRSWFRRDDTLYVYDDAVINPDVQCRGYTTDCVQEEQYFSSRRVYQADDVTVALNEIGLYGETTVTWRRLTGTLGLRYDYNDFLRNHDLAWRSRARFDVFGDGRTQLMAGLNRYYGAPLLSYKLREARAPYYTEYRSTEQNIVTDWERAAGQGDYRYRFDGLKTPYSDEVALGLSQALFGGTLTLKLVRRDNRDEFSRTTTETQADGYRYYLMNNEGSSDYRGISLGWNGVYGQTLVNIHGTWSETETRNADYDDPVDATASSEYVWYRGKRIKYGELEALREDYNRPLVIQVAVSHRFSEAWSGTVSGRYRGGYDAIVETSRTVDGELVDTGNGEVVRESLEVYEDERRRATLLFDASLEHRYPIGDTELVAGVEVRNLLNDRVYTVSDGDSGIEPGRQLWLTLGLDF
jgi:hypothetical protein